MKREFVWDFDEEQGGTGWIPTFFKGAWSTDPRGIAHDAMEHRAPCAVGAVDEIMAMGSCWFIRGETGDLGGPFITCEQSVAIGVSSSLDEAFHSQADIPLLPASKLSFDVTNDALESIARRSTTEFLSEQTVYKTDEDAEQWMPDDLETRIVNLLRLGYRRADQRA